MAIGLPEHFQRLSDAFMATGWPSRAGVNNPRAMRAYANDLASIAVEHLLENPDDAAALAAEGRKRRRAKSRSSVGNLQAGGNF